MERKTYSELLRDPRWQKKRLEALNAADWKCAACRSGKNTLNVHHRKYRRGAMPWEYELHELQVLCEDCHAAHHDLKAAMDVAVSKLTTEQFEQALGFVEAMVAYSESDRALDRVGHMPGYEKLEFPIRNWRHAFGYAYFLSPESLVYPTGLNRAIDGLEARGKITIDEVLNPGKTFGAKETAADG